MNATGGSRSGSLPAGGQRAPQSAVAVAAFCTRNGRSTTADAAAAAAAVTGAGETVGESPHQRTLLLGECSAMAHHCNILLTLYKHGTDIAAVL